MGSELTVSWYIYCVGVDLDSKVSTQPNPRRGIIVTFRIVPSIAHVDATICICFIDGAVTDRLVVLDCLDEGFGLAGTSTPERSKWGAEVLKRRVDVMRFCSGSKNPACSSFTISGRMKLVPILTCHTGGIGCCFWSAKNLSTHLRRELLTQRSMSSGQKKTSRIQML